MCSCDLASVLFGKNVCSTCRCSSVRMFVLLSCGRICFRMLGLASVLVVFLCCCRAASEVLEVEVIVCVLFVLASGGLMAVCCCFMCLVVCSVRLCHGFVGRRVVVEVAAVVIDCNGWGVTLISDIVPVKDVVVAVVGCCG